ncbi:MAG: XdhC family protein [Calditrichaeota bacterium]|nr:MAG: XdhC family protein [Calditrichota bacterium]
MRDILPEISRWVKKQKPFALATVISTWGSAPRGVGSAMAIGEDLQIAGSVSGGCVEGAVIEEAIQVIKGGQARVLNFGVDDETAWNVGLSCGGTIRVLVEKALPFSERPLDVEIWKSLHQALTKNRPVVLVTQLPDERSRSKTAHWLVFPDGSLVGDMEGMTAEILDAAHRCYTIRQSQLYPVGEREIFIQVFPARDRLLIIGAGHIAIPLIKFAQELNFETIVIDPRGVFANPERFTVKPDQLICQWPQEVLNNLEINEETYAVLLTHDPKIDDEALKILLKKPVAYIGALGSVKTHKKRIARLQEMGFSLEEIEKIHGPAGLDIQAHSPAEIALSIIGQIVQVKNNKSKLSQP